MRAEKRESHSYLYMVAADGSGTHYSFWLRSVSPTDAIIYLNINRCVTDPVGFHIVYCVTTTLENFNEVVYRLVDEKGIAQFAHHYILTEKSVLGFPTFEDWEYNFEYGSDEEQDTYTAETRDHFFRFPRKIT